VEVSFPLQLRVTAAKGGQPDLQLRLLAFSSGTETQRLREQARGAPALPTSVQGIRTSLPLPLYLEGFCDRWV